MAASPLTAFLISPVAQFVAIPFMTTGAGVDLIGGWFGTGPDRGLALVFTVTGLIGLAVTLVALRTRHYRAALGALRGSGRVARAPRHPISRRLARARVVPATTASPRPVVARSRRRSAPGHRCG